MSPMIARARENNPPAPSPWIARKTASDGIDHARVHSIEPMVKIEIAKMKNGLRP